MHFWGVTLIESNGFRGDLGLIANNDNTRLIKVVLPMLYLAQFLQLLRKEKQLYFTKAVQKIADIPTYSLATSLSCVVDTLTPQTLFGLGGELYEAGTSLSLLDFWPPLFF